MSLLPLQGVVLAGGRSSRMGRDKARISLGGRTLVERALANLAQVCQHCVIAGGDPALAAYGRVLPDQQPGLGPLAGILVALQASPLPWNLVLAVDMPQVPVALLQQLAQQALRSSAIAVVARVGGAVQPLCAAYRTEARAGLQQGIEAGERRVIAAAQQAGPVEYLDLPSQSAEWFLNLNTPEDLDALPEPERE
ncbi:MAG: molybdenum cofactor guanylyltransferase [Acidobacteriota bacterium]|nr:molybdenum cofactor guanylyltransferase [Acidobacteriota bacterium]